MQETESNILDSLKLDKALKLAKQKSKEGSTAEARTIYKRNSTSFQRIRRPIKYFGKRL